MADLTFQTLDDLKHALQSGVIPNLRIQQARLGDDLIWIKQPESLSLRMFLQKGNATRAFASEQAAHIRFASLGLPVPELLLTGPTYTVTSDIGGNLKKVIRKRPQTESRDLLTKAVIALAKFHQAGTYHGRPNLKDICWDGTRISFLDFERAEARSDPKRGMAEDVLMFVFNSYAEAKGDYPPLSDIMHVYREHAPKGVWTDATRRAKRYRIMAPLTWPIRQRKRAWEFKAIPRTLNFFATNTGS